MSEYETGLPAEAEESEYIELEGEDGETVRFEHLATLEHEGEYYLALAVPGTEDGEEGVEVTFLRIDEDENGDELYSSLEDDDLEEALMEELIALSEDAEAGE